MILLDEPFSNLDAALRVRVRSDLKRILRAAGTPPVIFVTHDQDEALSFADKVAVMFDGQVVQIDTPQNLYAHPNSLRVATFLGEANVLEGRLSNGLVSCELGNLPYAQDSETHAEAQTKILIRPESLQLVKKDSELPTGEVMDREYYGHDQMILVQMPSGQILRCRCSPNTPVEKGDRVGLSIKTPVSLFQPTNDNR